MSAFFTINEAAQHCGVSAFWIRLAISSGDLVSYRRDGVVYIPRREFYGA